MSYTDIVAQDRRLLILRCIEAAAGYGAGVPLVAAFLRSLGHEQSHDTLATDLAWLAEQGLVEITDGDRVVRATQRGVDVALGRAQVPGVRRPGPRE